jgi:hypothetical protein
MLAAAKRRNAARTSRSDKAYFLDARMGVALDGGATPSEPR